MANDVDRYSDKRNRPVREAIWIRKTRKQMNRDEGTYELVHVYNDVIQDGRHS